MTQDELKKAIFELEGYGASLERQLQSGDDNIADMQTQLERLKFIKQINDESLAYFKSLLDK